MTASERKQNTERLLQSLDIPFIEHLPMIEEEDEVQIRSAQDIARRILILVYLNLVAEEEEAKDDVIEFLKAEGLWDFVTSEEKKLFQNKLTDQQKVNISWRSEAIWLLLWTINKVDGLELPEKEVSVQQIMDRLPKFMADTKNFIDTATIRQTSEILDASDLIYRLHWATRQSELNNLQTHRLNPSVVLERHYAINWVTYYADN